MVGGSLALTLFAGFSDEPHLLGTDTRASELLIGGLLAVVLFNAKVTGRLARRGLAQLVAVILGLAALVGAIALWSQVPQDASWLYRGGFTLYALISATLITAAILPVGPVAWLLAVATAAPPRPDLLRRVPLPLADLPGPAGEGPHRPAGRCCSSAVAITIVLAELSYRFLEMPIRRGQPIFRVRHIRVAPFAAVGIGVVAILLTATAPASKFNFADTQDQLSALAADSASLPPTTIDPRPCNRRPNRVWPPSATPPRCRPVGALANYMRNSDQACTSTASPGSAAA